MMTIESRDDNGGDATRQNSIAISDCRLNAKGSRIIKPTVFLCNPWNLQRN